MTPPNPHAYDDDAYLAAVIELQHAIHSLWVAGADDGNIAAEVENAIELAKEEDG